MAYRSRRHAVYYDAEVTEQGHGALLSLTKHNSHISSEDRKQRENNNTLDET